MRLVGLNAHVHVEDPKAGNIAGRTAKPRTLRGHTTVAVAVSLGLGVKYRCRFAVQISPSIKTGGGKG